MKRVNRFFWWCSGARIEILERCPTEEAKYFGIGGTILFTALMAGFAGGYAFSTAFDSIILSVLFGIFWGCLIFNLDRYIVSTIGKGDGTQKITKEEWISAAPRLLMAVLLGIVISTPLELRLFKDEIELEINGKKNLLIEDRKEQLNAEFSAIGNYESRIDALRDEIAVKRAEKDKYYDAYLCERDGTCGTGFRGRGPEYREKKARYEAALKDFESVEKANMGQIAQLTNKMNDLIEDRKKREDDYIAAADKSVGLLARLDALSRLTSESSSLQMAKWLITLLFIFIEVAPVLFKLMMEAGPYEEMLERIKYEASISEKLKISNLNGEINTNMVISTEKNKLRLNAELKGNQSLMESVALAQADIAKVAVEKWREEELNKLKTSVAHIITPVPSVSSLLFEDKLWSAKVNEKELIYCFKNGGSNELLLSQNGTEVIGKWHRINHDQLEVDIESEKKLYRIEELTNKTLRLIESGTTNRLELTLK